MLNWRAGCLTAGNERTFLPVDYRCRLFLYLFRRVVLPVEHQPASGRTSGAGGTAVSVWPASGINAAMSTRLLAGAAGRGMAVDVLAGAGGGAGPFATFDDRKRPHATPGDADFAIPSSTRLAHVAVAGRSADGGGAAAIAAVVGAGGGSVECAVTDPDRRINAGADMPGVLALPHQHHLAAARPGAGVAAGELARATSGLVSAAVHRQPVATARFAR